MGEPTSQGEYDQRAKAEYRQSGFGLDVETHMPCPFCACGDFMVFKILELNETLAKGASCKECGRSARGVITNYPGGGVGVEIVQTNGAAPSPWIPIRRAKAEDFPDAVPTEPAPETKPSPVSEGDPPVEAKTTET